MIMVAKEKKDWQKTTLVHFYYAKAFVKCGAQKRAGRFDVWGMFGNG